MTMKLKILDTAHHRNGVAGTGFDVVLFKVAREQSRKVAILFDDPGYCAVLDVTLLAAGDIAFGSNSWRGDDFEPELRRAVEHTSQAGNQASSGFSTTTVRAKRPIAAAPSPACVTCVASSRKPFNHQPERSLPMTNLYNVHLYREMRLSFPGIKANSPIEAAESARHLPTEDATSIDECDGDDLGALVDLQGDADYSESVMVDFESERLRKAAPQLLAALQEAVAEIEHWHADMLSAEERNHPRGNGWARVYDKANAAIADATAA
jgi:hypothetical protein